MSTKQNNSTISELLAKRLGGIKKYLTDPNIVIPVGGKPCHPADVLAFFQHDLDAREAVDVAHATVKSTIADRKIADTDRATADSALKSYVVHLYGATSTEAQAFGYPPPKPKTTTVATKAAAIQKSAATRAARGTKGSVQKADVSGTALVYSSAEAAAAAEAKVPPPAAGAPVTGEGHASPAAPPAAPPAATPAANGTNGAAH
jgi:hypothetical protein